MKAMILAAGRGTRVQPITHVIPKPMIPILQKPVMEFLLELLKEHGFKEVMVNVSHLAEAAWKSLTASREESKMAS
jgi:mannose-1-phosphate guanylyltransferase